jgi:cytoskeletal protein CcmA (bactofilin family)
MFGSKNGSSGGGASATDKLSIIADGTVFRGDIETNGNLRIDGKIIGNIISTGNVAIGKGGSVDGNIAATMLKISGRVKGNIDVATRCILDASAAIHGDLRTKSLMIEEGAGVNGKISMDMKEPYAADADGQLAAS